MEVNERKYKIGIRENGYLDIEVVVVAKDLIDAIDHITKQQIAKKSKTWKTRLISETDCYGKILRRGDGKF